MKANDRQIAGDHYRQPIQTWDFIHRNGIGYLAGNIIKYVVRYQKKNGIEDLNKARHYLDKLIEEQIPTQEEFDLQITEEEEQAMREISLARSRDGV